MHAGAEGSDRQHVRPGTEGFLGENRGDAESFSHIVVDAGADLLEWEPVHSHRSGTGRSRVEEALDGGRDIVLNIDVKGGLRIRELVPEAMLVFLAPPSLDELDRRRRDRGTEDPAELARRASDAQIEMGYSAQYDAVVVNDDVDRAAQEILDLIQQRRGRS